MESLNQALIDCVRVCGGSKTVGGQLWPDAGIEVAQRKLLDCLNPDRPAHLTPEQMVFVLRLARDKGHHSGVNFVLESLGYAPTTPIEPRDEAADLMRKVIENQQTLTVLMSRLNVLQPQFRSVA